MLVASLAQCRRCRTRSVSPSLLSLCLALFFCCFLVADARNYRHLSRYEKQETKERGERRRKQKKKKRRRQFDFFFAFEKREKKTRCALTRTKNLTSFFIFFLLSKQKQNREFPGLDGKDAPDSLSTSTKECDNTETGL